MRVNTIICGWMLLSGGLGCASQRPIPRELQDAFFHCPGVTVEQVEANLAAAGHAIQSKGPTYVQTDWGGLRGAHFEQVLAARMAGVSNLQVKTSAVAEEQGIRWRIFSKSKTQVGFMMAVNNENEWSTITMAQLDDEASRTILNGLRMDLCGGPPFLREIDAHPGMSERQLCMKKCQKKSISLRPQCEGKCPSEGATQPSAVSPASTSTTS